MKSAGSSLQEAGNQAAIVAQLRAELLQAVTQSVAGSPGDSDTSVATAACSLIALGAACVCAAVWTTALGAGGCPSAPVPVVLGTDAGAALSMTNGAACTVLLRTGSAVLDDLTIDIPPQHGTVVARGRTGVVYRPHRQFQGEDRFAFTVRGRLGPTFEFSVVRVQVNVR
jgi:hypothetical protein